MSPAVGTVVLDTGPLVALLNRAERHHSWIVAEMARVSCPVVTCEPVLAEACHLLKRYPGGSSAVVELVNRGLMGVPFRLGEHSEAVERLLRRYAGIPMSLADGCLVRMTELLQACTVVTFDSDFLVYRRHGRQVIPTLMPIAP